MSVDHPWAVLPELVEAGILTQDEAKAVVLGTSIYMKLMLELQALISDARTKSEDITPSQLTSLVSKIQMAEGPSF